jgi:hypothetical protein
MNCFTTLKFSYKKTNYIQINHFMTKSVLADWPSMGSRFAGNTSLRGLGTGLSQCSL